MKKILTPVISAFLFMAPFGMIHGQLLSEIFSNDFGFSKSPDGFFSDGSSDYWGIYDVDFDGGPIPTGVPSYSGFFGDYLVGEDFDGTPPYSGTQTLTWTVDITNNTSLNMSVLVAADNSTTWGTGGYIKFNYEIDGGGVTPLLWFYGINGFSSLFEDSNFDGTGDGSSLSLNATTFNKSISGTGSTLILTLEANTTVTGQEFGVDDIVVSGTVLPVELAHFDALNKNKYNLLTWQTASETNNQGFEIERSLDGRYWQKLDFIKGNGNSQTTQSYQYIDQLPRKGMNYYRLKQLDYDGAFEYSDVRSVEFLDSRSLISVSPNPTQSGTFTLYLPETEATTIEMTLYDYTGRLVRQNQIENLQTNINVADLEKGIYLIRVDMEGVTAWERLVVQ